MTQSFMIMSAILIAMVTGQPLDYEQNNEDSVVMRVLKDQYASGGREGLKDFILNTLKESLNNPKKVGKKDEVAMEKALLSNNNDEMGNKDFKEKRILLDLKDFMASDESNTDDELDFDNNFTQKSADDAPLKSQTDELSADTIKDVTKAIMKRKLKDAIIKKLKERINADEAVKEEEKEEANVLSTFHNDNDGTEDYGEMKRDDSAENHQILFDVNNFSDDSNKDKFDLENLFSQKSADDVPFMRIPEPLSQPDELSADTLKEEKQDKISDDSDMLANKDDHDINDVMKAIIKRKLKDAIKKKLEEDIEADMIQEEEEGELENIPRTFYEDIKKEIKAKIVKDVLADIAEH